MLFFNKKNGLFYFTVFVIFGFLLAGCVESSESPDGIAEKEITLLNETQVSNFIYVLPEIMDFSQKYQSLIGEKEKNSPDQNEKFFQALKKSENIKYSLRLNHFSSMDELISVYKNVVLAYTSIKTELTNYNTDIENLSNKIYGYISNYSLQLNDNNLTKDERKKAGSILKGLRNDNKRIMNILIVKKYEPDIDKVVQSFNK